MQLGDPPFNPEMAEHFLIQLRHRCGDHAARHQEGGLNTTTSSRPPSRVLARTLRDAVRIEGRGVPSTKGTL
ncbi:MAG: hypothetical protein R2704_09975 [Microthrixaceae bacterium]